MGNLEATQYHIPEDRNVPGPLQDVGAFRSHVKHAAMSHEIIISTVSKCIMLAGI